MADPLSIASGALAVITATTQTFSLIVKFIRDCQDARADLNQITRELLDLTLILELVKGESAEATENRLPHRLQSLVHTILKHCTATVQQIEVALDKCRGKPGPLLWTIYEKEKVASLKLSLEATKNSLNIALETVNMFVQVLISRLSGCWACSYLKRLMLVFQIYDPGYQGYDSRRCS